jgi:heme exporter protein D
MSTADDWKTEYHELSEDYRYFIQMAWQSIMAVLAVDGLLLGTVINIKHPSYILGFVPLLASALTFIMFVQQRKWILRWKGRIQRLEQYDKEKKFSRFSSEETGIRKFPLEPTFPTMMVLVGTGLSGYAAFLFTRSYLISAVVCVVVLIVVVMRARKLIANFAKQSLSMIRQKM